MYEFLKVGITKEANQQNAAFLAQVFGNPKLFAEEYIKRRNAQITLNLGYYPYSDIEPRNFWGDATKLKTILKHE